jgi:hypothetical protein
VELRFIVSTLFDETHYLPVNCKLPVICCILAPDILAGRPRPGFIGLIAKQITQSPQLCCICAPASAGQGETCGPWGMWTAQIWTCGAYQIGSLLKLCTLKERCRAPAGTLCDTQTHSLQCHLKNKFAIIRRLRVILHSVRPSDGGRWPPLRAKRDDRCISGKSRAPRIHSHPKSV